MSTGENTSILRRPEVIVFLVALVVRLLYLSAWASSPFFVPVTGGNDRSLYDSVARTVAGGQILPKGVFQYMPLYGWFLGAIYAVSGKLALSAAGLVGAILDAVTAALIVVASRAAGATRPAPAIAGGLYALYPLAIVYSVVTMPNTLNALLLLCVAMGFMRLARGAPPLRWLLCGLLAGVASLGFAGMLLVAVAGAIAVAAFGLKRGVVDLRGFMAFLAGFMLPIAPVAVHNTRAEGSFVLITAHGGFNLYMGNHEGATGYPMQLPGFRGDQGSLLADAWNEVEREQGSRPTAAQFSRYWSSKARTFIFGSPADAARLYLSKFMKFWNLREYDDMRLLPMVRLAGIAFSSPLWPGFGIAAFLGLCGLAGTRGNAPLRVVLAAGVVSLLIFFITARYRLTLVPILLVFGALALTRWRELAMRAALERAQDAWKGIGCAAATAGCAAVLVCWPIPQGDFRALDRYNVAAHLLDRGMAEEALTQAKAGIDLDPGLADLHFVAGNALFGLGRFEQAAQAYREAIGRQPAHAGAHFNLAVTLKSQGRSAEALREAQMALKIDPAHPMAAAFIAEVGAQP
jgi:hypothetical protein